MVGESNLRGGRSLGMNDGRVGHPCLAGIFKMGLHAAPFVPSQETVATSKEESNEDEDDDTNLGHLDKVTTQVIDNGEIQVIAECDPRLLRDRHSSRIE